MKKISTFLIALLCLAGASAQQISYDDFRSVIPFLVQEDYKSAFQKTSQLLDAAASDTSQFYAMVAYMHIYAAAGMVTLDLISHGAFKTAASRFIGKRLVMPGHPCVDSTQQAFNSLKFITEKGMPQGLTITANQKKTNILLFEYIQFSGPLDPADYINSQVRCRGILQSVEINPNESKIWIGRIRLNAAVATVMTPR